MTLELFHALRADDGQRLLAALAQEPLREDDLLPVLERYRKSYPAELVSAAVEQTHLRRRAREKFSRADEMYFTAEGLAMASGEEVARHTAGLFTNLPRVLDLCCGIGGDTFALAERTEKVIAVDRDPLAIEIARANARVLELERKIDFVVADATAFMPGGAALLGPIPAIFIDPGRRAGARRNSNRPEDYSPPLSWCLELARYAPLLAIKASPALDYEAALAGVNAEVEIISLRGECKEAMIWLGAYATTRHRATVLPSRFTISDIGPASGRVGEIGEWLFEPDSAVVRAHLVQRVAGEFGLWRIDPDIAYLSGAYPIESPLLTGFRVQEVVPWSLKRLNAALAARNIGRIVIKKRGFPLEPEALRPKLKLSGPAHAVLICTQAMGKHVVVIAEG